MTTPNDTLTQQLQEEARKCFQSEDDGAFRMDKWDSEQLDDLIASTVQRVREDGCKLEDRLPEHEASLHITHNQHKAYYDPIERYIEDNDIEDDDWATPTSRKRAIETDSIWELQWYPNTPVGFNVLYGATLEEILQTLTQDTKE